MRLLKSIIMSLKGHERDKGVEELPPINYCLICKKYKTPYCPYPQATGKCADFVNESDTSWQPPVPKGAYCPDCGSAELEAVYGNRLQCKFCGKVFT